MNRTKALFVGVVACLAASICAYAASPAKQADLRRDMRKLWEDHITWTRLYIVEAVSDLPGKDATAQRLLKNQEDIGNAVKPFYGDAPGAKLTDLLKDHIKIATEIIDAAKASDNAKKTDAVGRWGANADAIATLLSGANPRNWPLADMKKMMRDHLDLTTTELVAYLQKDWAGGVTAYDKVHDQILHMADMLAEGIAKQFPNKV